MTDDEWRQIEPFAEAAAKANQRVDAWAMTNAPTNPRERIEAQVQGERLRAERDKAYSDLDAVKRRVLG